MDGDEMFWDGEPCPTDSCDGELEGVDQFNVTCVTCDGAWSHIVTQDGNHILVTEDNVAVAEIMEDEDV